LLSNQEHPPLEATFVFGAGATGEYGEVHFAPLPGCGVRGPMPSGAMRGRSPAHSPGSTANTKIAIAAFTNSTFFRPPRLGMTS